MSVNNNVYFRQRAHFHLLMSKQAKNGIACIHRRFAQLYLELAAKAERLKRSERVVARRKGPDLRRYSTESPVMGR
jgi:hypothetical protein